MTEFTPSATQAAAIREIKEWFETRTEQQQVFRLFGYAGSGKSTVLKGAVRAKVTSAVPKFEAEPEKPAVALPS